MASQSAKNSDKQNERFQISLPANARKSINCSLLAYALSCLLCIFIGVALFLAPGKVTTLTCERTPTEFQNIIDC
ncbi:hypothetical protein WA1_03970 [Scytonema hofmannii PCC 7110]|uniref:Uncharacterized protein n=1 Tax=Scytonema hofmannii PCC 7110 TaxID=128403 RepID=A0A139X4J7_9CYAN|nr:hypothetical protein WA1_03970 [Scytonema hofmannii PCC 7110]